MRYFWLIIVIVILIDVFVCQLYCSYKKKRSIKFVDKKGTSTKDTGAKTELQFQKQSRTGLKQSLKTIIIQKFFPWCDSLLRVNLKLTGYIPSHTVRNFFYRNVYKVDLGKNAVLYYGAEIRAPWNLHIGEGSIIGDLSILDARNGIFIGNNVNFSTGVWIWTLQHDISSKNFGVEGQGKPVTIGDRAWLSSRVTVLPGSKIGEGSVVAAGAVVTKSIESFSIWGGIPAKKIGERTQQLEYEFNGSHMHFL